MFFPLIFAIIFFSCSHLAFASTAAFSSPISVQTVRALLDSLIGYLRTITGTIAIIFLVIGGMMYMLSGGNEKNVTRAKVCITAAVIGLALVLAAPAFLTDLISIFDVTNMTGGGSVSSQGGLYGIVYRFLVFLLSIVGTVAIISVVIAGIIYLTSAGDEKRIETAKKTITYSIAGIVVAFSALIIVKQVGILISGQIF